MTYRKLMAAFLAAASTLAATAALAAPSCTNWLQQSDGSYFRTCVDDNGTQYCEQAKNGVVSRVRC